MSNFLPASPNAGSDHMRLLENVDFIFVNGDTAAPWVDVLYGGVATIGNLVTIKGKIKLRHDDHVYIAIHSGPKEKLGAMVTRQDLNTTAEVVGGYGLITGGIHAGDEFPFINRDDNITGEIDVAFSFSYQKL